MSRKEVILVVSRALAFIQLISAFLELTYIPGRLYEFSHHSRVLATMGASESTVYFWTDDRIGLSMLMLRIVIYMIFAAMFWTCGPKVERFLCPIDHDQDAQANRQ